MLKDSLAICLLAVAVAGVPARAQTPPPAAGALTPGALAPAKVDAAEFVRQAANSDMFEIQSSQVALDRSRDDHIRDFAHHMIQDHTAASEKLKAAAHGQTIPDTLDQEHAGMLRQLQQASGSEFEAAYAEMQFDGHQRAVTLFNSYAQGGDNPDLKQFAQQTVPKLRDHLQQIAGIRNQLPGNNAAASQSSGSAGFLTRRQSGQWPVSQIEGLDVFTKENEKIGDVSEVVMNKSGKLLAVVIGVGGLLGVGERKVAVPFEQITFVMEPHAVVPQSSTTSPSVGAGPRAPAEVPDHATLSLTKDQLRSVPEFRSSR